MAREIRNVLFLCTGNSARSILAEAVLNRLGKGRFQAFSAGSQPKGAVHPQALALLERQGYPVVGLTSKSWDSFASGTPEFDLIITVCDAAAAEACPVWPGRPTTAHWGMPDPAAVTGDPAMVEAAFAQALTVLSRRIQALIALPLDELDPASLRGALTAVGRDGAPVAGV